MTIDRTKPPEPGIYPDATEDEYRSWIAFHYSATKHLLRSPLHWKHAKEHPFRSEYATMGTMIDCLLAGGQSFDQHFATRPATYLADVTKGRGENKTAEEVTKPFNLNSKACKQIMADLEASGKIIVTQAEADRAKASAKALSEHPLFAEWYRTGQMQVAIVWVDSETGVTCKGLIDLLVTGDDELLMVDVKSTSNADRGPFRRVMTDLGYHVQGGLYQDGYATLHGGLYPPFYLAVVEYDEPHGVAVYPLGPDSLATGLIEARKAMVVWQAIQRTGKHPGYGVYQDELDIMPWAINPDVTSVGLGG